MYLQNFCDSNDKIAAINKCDGHIFTPGVGAICKETDFYTLEKAEDPYCWEHAYAYGIEPKMSELFKKINTQSNRLTQNGAVILNQSDKSLLSVVMIMQLLRGEQAREYSRKIFHSELPKTINEAKSLFAPLSESQLDALKNLDTDEFYFKSALVDVTMNSERIKNFAKILFARKFLFFRTDGRPEFISSDNPVMFIDSISSDASPFANGLIYGKTIVYYPIFPHLLLYAAHPCSVYSVSSLRDCSIVDLDVNKDQRFINSINRKQFEQCYRQAFARSREGLEDLLKK